MVLNQDDIAVEDIEFSSDSSSDEGVDRKEKTRRHKKLLKEIGVKPSKKRTSTRNEPSQDVSEFAWSAEKDSSKKLQLHELVGSLPAAKHPVAKLKKKLRKMENTTKVLEKPLTTPETLRIERTVAYQDTAQELSKWNPIVQKNREAEQLIFPMNQFKPAPMSTKTLVNTLKPRNDLEREINAVLQGSKHLLERKDKELTEAEEEALKSFDLQEAMERRKDLQRSRALQSYYETKCRRMKKIKSKKYHRILKKEQQKSLEKIDLETLSKENPELFQSELEKAEKLRALERANLRHRNTSKWAKNLITKGRKTKEEQDVVREQLRLSRQLTEHKTVVESDDDEEMVGNKTEEPAAEIDLLQNVNGADNPWLLQGGNGTPDSELIKAGEGKVRKLKAIVTKESSQFQENDDDEDEQKSSGDEWEDNLAKKNAKKKAKKKSKKAKKSKISKQNDQREESMGETNVSMNVDDIESDQEYEGVAKLNELDNSDANAKSTSKKTKKSETKNNKLKGTKQQADTLRFLKEDKNVLELVNEEESSDDDDTIAYDSEQRMNIREAFANDDVIGDFVQEKDELVERSKPNPVDLTLPGWGEWGGGGLAVSSKKRKKFSQDPGPAPKRKDDKLSNVIISEVRNKKLAKHQVSNVPFPYTNKMEFERSIRQPIGENWNTPSVHSKLTEPRIRTLPGMVIDPLKPSKRLRTKLKTKTSD